MTYDTPTYGRGLIKVQPKSPGNGRRAQNVNKVPYVEILPMRLKPFVSGKGDGHKDVACLFEMSVLFACFKKNDFRQEPCSKEIQSFQSCFDTHQVDKANRKQERLSGEVAPGSKKMPYQQLNKFLKNYPPKYPLPEK